MVLATVAGSARLLACLLEGRFRVRVCFGHGQSGCFLSSLHE